MIKKFYQMIWFGIFNVLLFALIILAKWKRTPTKYYLSSLLFSVGIVAAGSLALSSKIIFEFPFLTYVHSPFSFLIAPLLYLTIRSSLKPPETKKQYTSLHSVPFLIALVLHLPFYLKDSNEKLIYLNEAFNYLPLNREVFFWSVIGQVVIYLSVIWFTISKKHRDLEPPYLRWSIILSAFLTSLVGVAIFRKLSFYNYEQSYLMAALLTVWTIYTIYHFFNPQNERESSSNKKYRKSGLTKVASEANVEKLMDYLNNQKPYLNSQFSLIEASDKLGLKPNYLSQSINQNLNRTFTEVLNECRIRHAADMIISSKYNHLTIEGIANEVGFKSKSAFYINFKKQIGQSPKQYKLSVK
ncbi:AraC family transcriptional regulator [Roseivirga sp. E12]|uniref:helix-turn-helix domain-containing protein n=1 Tax=Roseivirga sp. E12 TaxID=2819237 RepID=UPI001ABC8840|nr:AraC family transcriptional regulator [Roseivirga sp. E12]MBO3698681.1 helix-turn-helix transcriptional regulator [Roseivirga sp. E12]